jgi:hypothetical protein
LSRLPTGPVTIGISSTRKIRNRGSRSDMHSAWPLSSCRNHRNTRCTTPFSCADSSALPIFARDRQFAGGEKRLEAMYLWLEAILAKRSQFRGRAATPGICVSPLPPARHSNRTYFDVP